LSGPALWKAVADVARELPPSGVERLARRVEPLGGPAALGSQATPSVSSLESAWQAYRISGSVLAGALRGAAAAFADVRGRESVELVWTGPTTAGVPVRRTETVLVHLLRAAVREIFLVSFVAYEVPSVVDALNDATARGVRVSVLLETSVEHGGRLDVDSVARIRRAVPGAAVYVWAVSPGGGASRGAVHAKCVVIDSTDCLVTSANLTSAALERNMELGVLAKGGRLPKRLAEHLAALVDTRVVRRVE